MHTQWCTDVTVTNSDSQTRKKIKTFGKKYWLTKYVKKIVIKLLINEWQNRSLQWDCWLLLWFNGGNSRIADHGF